MRILLTLIFLVTCSTAQASWPYIPGPGLDDESAVGCDVCTDGLVFSYYANSLTVGDTGYSPCGCVVAGGDSSGTIVGTASIAGTSPNKYVNLPAGQNYISFDSAGIFNQSEGSMLVSFEINTWNNYRFLSGFFNSDANFITYILGTSGADIGVHRKDGGVNEPLRYLTGGFVSLDTVHTAIIRWSQSYPDVIIELYNSSGTMIDSRDSTAAITDLNTFPDILAVGNYSFGTMEAKVYKFKAWSTYSGAEF